MTAKKASKKTTPPVKAEAAGGEPGVRALAPTPNLPLDQYCGPVDPIIAAVVPVVAPWTTINCPQGAVIALNATNGWLIPEFGAWTRLPVEYATGAAAGTDAVFQRLT